MKLLFTGELPTQGRIPGVKYEHLKNGTETTPGNGSAPSDATQVGGSPTFPVAEQDARVAKLEAQLQALTEKANIKMSPRKGDSDLPQLEKDSQVNAACRPSNKQAGKSVLDNCQLTSHTPTSIKKWIALLRKLQNQPQDQAGGVHRAS